MKFIICDYNNFSFESFLFFDSGLSFLYKIKDYQFLFKCFDKETKAFIYKFSLEKILNLYNIYQSIIVNKGLGKYLILEKLFYYLSKQNMFIGEDFILCIFDFDSVSFPHIEKPSLPYDFYKSVAVIAKPELLKDERGRNFKRFQK